MRFRGHQLGLGVECCHGEGELRIPKKIKGAAGISGDRAEGNGIHVLEVKAWVLSEVLITNVAATEYCRHAIDQKDLVVHAVVKGRLTHRVVHLLAGATITHGVEEPHLHVGVGIEGLIRRVAAGVINIIKEDAHPHATVGGCQYLVGQPKPAVIALPEVVLNIESRRGEGREMQAAL